MLNQAVLYVRSGYRCDQERQQEEDPDPGHQRQDEHQDDRALPELDPLLLGLDVGASNQPASPDDQGLVQHDEPADERPLRPARAVEAAVETLRGVHDVTVGVAQGDGDRVTPTHQDALDQGLAAVREGGHGGQSSRVRLRAGPCQVRTWRSRRFWKRSTCPAVSMMFCVPVKNGWQFAQTSTRSSDRVEPTVHSVPQDPQWTLAWWYVG